MSEIPQNPLSRRKFIKTGAVATGLVGAGIAGAVIAKRRSQAPKAARARATNPFAYNVENLRKTDPSLIHYQQTGQIRSPHDEPRRIAIGADDALYIAAGNYVSILEPNGNLISEIALGAPARCVGVARDGDIFISLRDHLELFSREGRRRASWDAPAGRPFFTGIAVGDSEVFAADAGNRVVARYDRAGKLLGRIGEKNPERNIPGFIVPSPFFDVDLASDGLLRVSNPGRHRVEVYTTKGDLEFFWGDASANIEGFCGCCNPINVAMMPDGRCITCEKGLPRVKVYRSDGTFESVVAGPESFVENAKACSGDASECHQGGLDAAIDSRGRIYVLDLVANEIRIMTPKV